MIRRIGNKAKIAHLIYPLFPVHTIYIELFFGGGGMFFRKPRAKHNFLNDIDGDIFNCFKIIREKKDELIEYIKMTPLSTEVFNYLKTVEPKDDVEKAARFLILSSWGYLGKESTCRMADTNSKEILIKTIFNDHLELIGNNQKFLNLDFRKVTQNIQIRRESSKRMIYADPPYLSTTNNYSNEWTESDLTDLIEMCRASDHPFAISEFANERVIGLTKEAGLQITEICERRTLKNRNTEILITNYPIQRGLFDEL